MKTYVGRVGEVYFSRLDYESDMLDSIKVLAVEKDVVPGVFFALGAVSRAKFSYYDQSARKYVEVEVDEPLEILSCMGNVARLGSEVIVHAHIVFAGKSGESIGGHLVHGTKIYSGELFMMKLEGFQLTRAYDETTGLNQVT
jgi:predicted DNA-binding protein with PD1-like motif